MHHSFSPNLDSIEIARGVLAALSFSTISESQEVHINRLQEQFSRGGFPQLLNQALRTIEDMREAERLDQGYWAPTPTRTVRLNDEISLLLSVAPTKELQRHFPRAFRAGAARLIETDSFNHLPAQSLNSWLGHFGEKTPLWARNLIQASVGLLSSSIIENNLEVFSVNSYPCTNQNKEHPQWLKWNDKGAATFDGVGLFRVGLGSYYRYFLGKALNNKLTFLEGPSVQDNLRLQYGLASLADRPLTASVITRKDTIFLRLPLQPPMIVRRLLFAVCNYNSKLNEWVCRYPRCWPTLQIALKSLGCKVVNNG